MTETTRSKSFRELRAGDTFQLEVNGPVFIKCRGGFRPGTGGQLHSCQPHVAIYPYDPANALTGQERRRAAMAGQSLKLDLLTDPGHGWLKVPKKLLADLGIAGRITPYSYQRGEYAYLEEDLDMSTFLDAAKAAGLAISVRNRVSDKSSRVRHYNGYSAA